MVVVFTLLLAVVCQVTIGGRSVVTTLVVCRRLDSCALGIVIVGVMFVATNNLQCSSSSLLFVPPPRSVAPEQRKNVLALVEVVELFEGVLVF